MKIFAIAIVLATTAFGATIDIIPAIGPNALGSPNFNQWAANFNSAILANASTAGTPGTPSYFERAGGSVSGSSILVTSFPSWMGTADPGTAYGPAYANEYGNRLHFGIAIFGSGVEEFAIADLGFSLVSSDPYNALAVSFPQGAYQYSQHYVGIRYGADQQVGGGDDEFITSGVNTQLVNAIIGRGTGNALWPCGPGDIRPCGTTAERQAALDYWASYPGTQWSATGTYTLGNSLSQTVTTIINPIETSAVPEPSSMITLGTGMLFIGLGARRLRRH